MGSRIANYTYCLRKNVPRTRAQIWASHPVAEAPPHDITQWGHLSPISSSRRLSLLYTSQERRSVVASWSSQTDDLVVGNPEEMCTIRRKSRQCSTSRSSRTYQHCADAPKSPSDKSFHILRCGRRGRDWRHCLACGRLLGRVSALKQDPILILETRSGEKGKATHHIPC